MTDAASARNETADALPDDVAVLRREVERLQGELARTVREFEEFTSIVSHDLRSPLLSMTGCVELLREQCAAQLGEEGEELLVFINGGVQKLSDMMKGLLELSRIGSRPLAISECSLQTSLESALRELGPAIEASQAQVTHDPLPVVPADAARMLQVLQHLLDNALKFRSAAPPRVHIGAREAPDAWTFSVSDNGMGLPPEQIDRAFKVFQRLRGDDPKYPGVGIGLPLCRKIVERHGGRMWLESQPGQGTAVHFTLPRRS